LLLLPTITQLQKTGTVFCHFFNFRLILIKSPAQVCNFNDGNFVQILGLKLKDEGD